MADRCRIDGPWTLFGAGARRSGPRAPDEVSREAFRPASVPGNVEIDWLGHLDLARGNNVFEAQRLEDHEWWYRASFRAPPLEEGESLALVFDGIDTFATVFVNGRVVGTTDNMLIPFRLDVTSAVGPGDNELLVRIDPTIVCAREQPTPPYTFATGSGKDRLAVRKAQHMFGWDILPRIVSAGIWRPVWLEVVPAARFAAVYFATLEADVRRRAARVLVDWSFMTDRNDTRGWTVHLVVGNERATVLDRRVPVLGAAGRLTADVENVDLWWPRNFGPAVLYRANVELIDADGAVIARRDETIGLRTVELVPGSFTFRVNGERIFCKGTNWVALDALHGRDAGALPEAFRMLEDIGCNMVRCWGGNVYESDAFFERCDRAGILVWQDFAFACGIYPQDDAFAARVGVEAETVIRRLRNHPSLCVWVGNNENDEAYEWAGTRCDPGSDRISREVLARAVMTEDPLRPYVPSSPYRSAECVRAGGDPALMPEQHLWGPRGDYKSAYYTASRAVFVSEIGYLACPERSSLERFLDPDKLWPWQQNDQWHTHAVRPHPDVHDWDYRVPLLVRHILSLFDRVPDNLDDFIFASQAAQAEALKFFIEWWRQRKDPTTGLLWWNLRDGWPVLSDAVVDYYGNKKLAYDYVRTSQADVCAMCGEPVDARHAVVVVNDTLREVHGTVRLIDLDSGLLRCEERFEVSANARAAVGSIAAPDQPEMWTVTCDAAAHRTLNHYLAGPRPVTIDRYRGWLAALRAD